ncbi:nitroreductase/quinone reductase family protein [Amycolatopsis sp. PS_44_ISF1]|uniref:nitroreductase/quinone reductase family protein n=1 Tax=Amycolatopsis sp. PS_44_ISF1 TaxID=2974917 RepID=UPI0028DDD595|nr:nitroreductase/quinone reductase family protein [Amycolatopsis sp. PS_44_ISF1]MDT8910208.1 nitroreductase/quinone reductase family protein [Amycolatopsis sp. PS_44_ISF1]
MNSITAFREQPSRRPGLAVLTTSGAKTGLPRESLLGYVELDGTGVVVASAGGAARNPDWFHNVRADPRVTVETGDRTYDAYAGISPPEERDRLFSRVVEVAPGYASYQEMTTRVIPVVVLHRLDRVKGMGDWLVEVHRWLRAELVSLRESGGGAPPSPPDLRAHCAGFCTALTRHHQGEDTVAFPMLADRFPSLADDLAKLTEQHATVARIQRELATIVDVTELDRLITELDAHFAEEERAVKTALNAIADAPPS